MAGGRLVEINRHNKMDESGPTQLMKITDPKAYIKSLHFFLQNPYTIAIAVYDTPCGHGLTLEHAELMISLGLRENLFNKFRHSYAAVIDNGKCIAEKIHQHDAVEINISLENMEMRVVSRGYYANPQATIFVNGVDESVNRRGLNFVVYNKNSQTIVDSVSFDTYAPTCECARNSDLIILDKLREYQAKHPKVLLYGMRLPIKPTVNLSENEIFLKEHNISFDTILQDLDNPRWVLNKYCETPQDIKEVLTAPKSYHDIRGVRRFEDKRGKNVNIIGQHRLTTGQPQTFDRHVYLVGGCHVFGVGARDEGTIASRLQALFNEYLPESRVIVQNYGFYLFRERLYEIAHEKIAILNALPVKPGDMIIGDFDTRYMFPLIYLSEIFQRPHNYGEPFFEVNHFGEDGYRGIAQAIFPLIRAAFSTKDTAHSDTGTLNTSKFTEQDNTKLLAYKQILREFYEEKFSRHFGAVVVNCNPFTLGHYHLIEKAAAQVDHLFVFVVQEDLSTFPFDDRLKLVDEGVSGIKNVTVIPSGRFILSSLTFSEYFNKAEMQDRVIDSSLDVTIFAQEIAPVLNISVRFAGEESDDSVTRQYNETMAMILPQYGIKFVEIPRLKVDNRPVSASNVRALLEQGNWCEITKLVPPTTLAYLMKKYH